MIKETKSTQIDEKNPKYQLYLSFAKKSISPSYFFLFQTLNYNLQKKHKSRLQKHFENTKKKESIQGEIILFKASPKKMFFFNFEEKKAKKLIKWVLLFYSSHSTLHFFRRFSVATHCSSVNLPHLAFHLSFFPAHRQPIKYIYISAGRCIYQRKKRGVGKSALLNWEGEESQSQSQTRWKWSSKGMSIGMDQAHQAILERDL